MIGDDGPSSSVRIKDVVERNTLQLTPEETRLLQRVSMEYPHWQGLAAAVEKLTESPLLPGNLVEPLRDGDEAYPAMLEAIQQAATEDEMKKCRTND